MDPVRALLVAVARPASNIAPACGDVRRLVSAHLAVAGLELGDHGCSLAALLGLGIPTAALDAALLALKLAEPVPDLAFAGSDGIQARIRPGRFGGAFFLETVFGEAGLGFGNAVAPDDSRGAATVEAWGLRGGCLGAGLLAFARLVEGSGVIIAYNRANRLYRTERLAPADGAQRPGPTLPQEVGQRGNGCDRSYGHGTRITPLRGLFKNPGQARSDHAKVTHR